MSKKHKNKNDIVELFAYEMTEVKLMLQGEFATVSGKELGLSQHTILEKPQVMPPTSIPEHITTAYDAPQVELPATSPIQFPKYVAAGYVAPQVELPAANPVQFPEYVAAGYAAPQVELPAANPIQFPEYVTADYVAPQVELPAADPIQFPEYVTADYVAPQVELPAAVSLAKIDIPATTVSYKSLSIPPAITFDIKTVDAALQLPKLEIPSIPQEKKAASHRCRINKTAKSNCRTPARITVTKVPTVSISPVVLPPSPVRVPTILKPSSVPPAIVRNIPAPIPVPDMTGDWTSICSQFQPAKTASIRTSSDTALPKIPDIEKALKELQSALGL